MNWTATVRTLILCSILVFLHYTLRPLLAWDRASPDFLIIALLLAAVRVRPGVAAMIGFVIGLAEIHGATDLRVHLRAAEFFRGIFLADGGLHEGGAGEKKARAFRH